LQQPIGDWVNLAAGGVNWSLGNPADIILNNGESSNYLKGTLSNASPGYYSFPVDIKSNSGSTPVQLSIALLDITNAVIKTKTITTTITSTFSLQSIAIPSGNAETVPAFVGLKVTNLGNSGIITVNSVTIGFSPLKSINPDGPCYQDISFILDYQTPGIPGISSFEDIGIIGNNPMTGDPYENRPWTNNPGGSPEDQHITLPDTINPSNYLAEDISNPPVDFVHHFRVSAHGSLTTGSGTGQIVIRVFDKSTNTMKGNQTVVIPDGMGLSSYPVTITASGFADQVRIYVLSFIDNNVITVNLFRQDSSAYPVLLQLKKSYSDKTDSDDISFKGLGLYRTPLNLDRGYTSVAIHLELNGVSISETKTIEINSDCENQVLKMSWDNNLGGFDYWNFTSKKDFNTEIIEAGETSTNLLPEWPNSYGEFADTSDRRQSYRESVDVITVRSQNLNLDQVNAISTIRKSILVQIMNGRQNRRTVIVDSDNFTSYREEDKMYTMAFGIKMTDNNPSQRI